jgi:Acyl-CoA synthetases (AMP-forming)/AMP-acid ligases II
MYEDQSFHNLIDYWGEKTPDTAAVFDGNQTITYGELNFIINKVTQGLSRRNIQSGDKIMSFIPNCYEFIVLFFALAKLGAILIPSHSNLVKRELEDQIDRIHPKAVLVSNPKCINVLKSYIDTVKIITIGFQADGCISFSGLLEEENCKLKNEIIINPKKDTFLIMFTSGTTGVPKGVELTYYNLFQAAKNLGYRLQGTSEDIFLVPLPIAHMFGIVVGILLPFFFGAKIVLMKKYVPSKAIELIEKEKITVIYGVPTMFVTELEEYKKSQADISSLRTGIVAGAAVGRMLREQIHEELQCNIMVAYGSTETVSISCTSLEDPIEKIYNTVGRPFARNKVKVINANGDSLRSGQAGELLCKGYGLMKGYYQMPEETKQVIDQDGWYHSGDMATIDESGYIRIVGRIKDMIIRGGNNIYPQEVENVYYLHPDVLHICLKGHPDAWLGEQSWAYIQLRKNSQETEESLRTYVIGKISQYKIPDRIILVDKMPLLENGKIDKQSLAVLYS